MAHAALPGLLPSPPKCAMLPLLPAPPCAAIILPNNSPPRPSCADAAERWDSNKKTTATSSSSSTTTSSSSSSSPIWASSGDKWGSSKHRPVTVSRASSAERWDAHKKPRPPQAGGVDDDGQSSTGSNDMELDDMPRRAFYAGPGFLASPEPSMLPMPSSSLMVRVAA
ncbi:unnamed protein product [Urochloa decumbens]|uniref:Uncharacterized protein n=1 Tax=Urochloa decumbens TaxID=240449 RepID=A0ABC8W859_9POAL